MFPKDFLNNMEIVFRNEGIYSNDPDDPGGETFVGIARNFHPDWQGWETIDYLKNQGVDLENWEKEDVINSDLYNYVLDFYYNEYWKKLHLDKLANTIKTSLFDSAINMGKKTAIKILQRALNVIDDGIFGPITLEKALSIDPELLVSNFKLKRIEYYVNLCYNKPIYKKYLLGWVNRALRT
jgi:lysozyme family protein